MYFFSEEIAMPAGECVSFLAVRLMVPYTYSLSAEKSAIKLYLSGEQYERSSFGLFLLQKGLLYRDLFRSGKPGIPYP